MSMQADIERVFKKANGIFGLEKEKCAELFLEVISALEWDLDDLEVDYEDPKWQEKEKQKVIDLLFPEV